MPETISDSFRRQSAPALIHPAACAWRTTVKDDAPARGAAKCCTLSKEIVVQLGPRCEEALDVRNDTNACQVRVLSQFKKNAKPSRLLKSHKLNLGMRGRLT